MYKPFDPLKFGFYRLDIDPPNFSIFERDLGALTETGLDYLRLNVFLSQSKHYVTVWAGLFDPGISTDVLKFKNQHLMDFHQDYYEIRFRGNIRDKDTAKVILEALDLDRYSPSKLEVDDQGRLCCTPLKRR